jgi:hypothetical protein
VQTIVAEGKFRFVKMDEATKSEKAKPEILKHGGNGGKNRRKQRILGVRVEDWKSTADCDAF